MRTLNETELNNVSGGTFGLLSLLLGGFKRNDCQPEPKCRPEPKCAPKPKKGC